jgi:hypothetical protein
MEKGRRWFQFRLTTIMIVTVVASWIVWANVAAQPGNVHTEDRFDYLSYGWPYIFLKTVNSYQTSQDFYWRAMVADAASGICILGAVAGLSELFARRRS